MSLAITKESPKSEYMKGPALFPRLGADMDRLIVPFLGYEALKMLDVCREWKNNQSINTLRISWAEKDQAAITHGFPKKLVQIFRKYYLSLWDVPYTTNLLVGSANEMPKIRNAISSIARFSFLNRPHLLFVLQSKEKGLAFESPIQILDNHRLHFKLRPLHEVLPGAPDGERPIVLKVSCNLSGQGGDCSYHSYTTGSGTCDLETIYKTIDEVLADTNEEFGLPNRLIQVAPQDSQPIPALLPPVVPARDIPPTLESLSQPQIRRISPLAYLVSWLFGSLSGDEPSL
jgi:hypothetical protein